MNARYVQDARELIERGICWATLPLPPVLGPYHFLTIGDSRSGKTTIIRHLLQSVLPRIEPGSKKRAILFDAKGDLYPFLVALGLEDRVRLLNPFDARCHAWDIRKDIPDYATALELAAAFIPEAEKGEDKPFFPRASQLVLAAVMDGLNYSPIRDTWTFRDLVLVLRSPQITKAMMDRSPDGAHTYAQILDGARDSVGDVVATMATRLGRYAPVAAAWHNRPLLALSEWIEREQIIVLGATPRNRTTLGDINAAIFHRVSQLILDQPEADASGEADSNSPQPQTWVVIDELTYAGKLPMLVEALATSASKGGCYVLGFQHIGPLREFYRESTGSIIRHCKNYAFLRTTDLETQEFLAKYFGNYEADVPEHSYSTSRADTFDTRLRNLKGHLDPGPSGYTLGNSKSVTIRRVKRERVLPESFAEDLPAPNERLGIGLSAYVRAPWIRPAFVTIAPDFIRATKVPNPAGVPPLERMPSKPVPQWSAAEEAKLLEGVEKPPVLPTPKSGIHAQPKEKSKLPTRRELG